MRKHLKAATSVVIIIKPFQIKKKVLIQNNCIIFIYNYNPYKCLLLSTFVSIQGQRFLEFIWYEFRACQQIWHIFPFYNLSEQFTQNCSQCFQTSTKKMAEYFTVSIGSKIYKQLVYYDIFFIRMSTSIVIFSYFCKYVYENFLCHCNCSICKYENIIFDSSELFMKQVKNVCDYFLLS